MRRDHKLPDPLVIEYQITQSQYVLSEGFGIGAHEKRIVEKPLGPVYTGREHDAPRSKCNNLLNEDVTAKGILNVL